MSQSTVAWTDHKAILLSGLRDLFENGQLADLQVRCRGRVFQVHRLIVNLFTDFFRCCGGIWTEIDIDPDLFESVLKFIYYGQVTVTYDSMEGFLSTCKFLGVRLFKDSELNAEGITETQANALCFQERYELNDFQLICHHCYKCFADEKTMKKHNWNCGRQQTRYKCKSCHKVFSHKVELSNHELFHPNESQKKFKCPVKNCTHDGFSYKSEVWEHFHKDHAVINHKCLECHRNFKFGYELRDHEVSEHGKKRTHVCRDCKECFATYETLRNHRRAKHVRKSKAKDKAALTQNQTTKVCKTSSTNEDIPDGSAKTGAI